MGLKRYMYSSFKKGIGEKVIVCDKAASFCREDKWEEYNKVNWFVRRN